MQHWATSHPIFTDRCKSIFCLYFSTTQEKKISTYAWLQFWHPQMHPNPSFLYCSPSSTSVHGIICSLSLSLSPPFCLPLHDSFPKGWGFERFGHLKSHFMTWNVAASSKFSYSSCSTTGHIISCYIIVNTRVCPVHPSFVLYINECRRQTPGHHILRFIADSVIVSLLEN